MVYGPRIGCVDDAFCKVLDQISALPSEVDVFLSLHACYYHVRTREFFTVVDEQLLAAFEPSVVINLIDDLFDLFARLAQRGGLFDRMLGLGRGPAASVRHFSRLFQILQWRSAETLLADHLAESAFGNGLRPTVLAVKHPLETVAKLLYSPQDTRFYLSHPISEPRRMYAGDEAKEADALVSEVNQVADALRQEGIVFEPTTIDELLFQKLEDPRQKGSTKRVPRLVRRWPLPDERTLLWTSVRSNVPPLDPARCFVELASEDMSKAIFERAGDPDTVQHLLMVSSLVEALQDEIGVRVSSRDHRLVEQADYVVAYRPVFAGNASGGVKKEIEYHRYLASHRLRKREGGVFVLNLPEDLANYRKMCMVSHLASLEWDGIQPSSDPDLKTLLEEAVSTGPAMEDRPGAEALLEHVRQHLASNGVTLGEADAGVLADEPSYQDTEILRECANRLLEIATTEQPPYTRFLNADDSAEFCELMSPIAFADKIRGLLGGEDVL